MKYKREEYFRYTFGTPLPAQFKIEKVNSKLVESSRGVAEIIDLSPSGLKLSTKLKIDNFKRNEIQLTISFSLNDYNLSVKGVIVWNKESHAEVVYGIEFLPDQAIAEDLIKQLKVYSRERKKR